LESIRNIIAETAPEVNFSFDDLKSPLYDKFDYKVKVKGAPIGILETIADTLEKRLPPLEIVYPLIPSARVEKRMKDLVDELNAYYKDRVMVMHLPHENKIAVYGEEMLQMVIENRVKEVINEINGASSINNKVVPSDKSIYSPDDSSD